MAAGASCPPATAIDGFARGFGAPSERRRLEAHVEGCLACRVLALQVLGEQPSSVTESLQASLGVWARTVAPAVASPSGELAPGDRVGRHLVIGHLGAGGMGTVYEAYDTALERKIALKFLSGSRGDEATRLVAEASAMARLSHPNVVTVHDVGKHDERPFLAMEFIKGKTLRQWRDEAPRSVREILNVMAAAARGLEAAHTAGIIHRDVKPANILVAGPRVLVTDFGISVREGEGAGALAGTPAYMAPEQLRGQAATPASDVFGFCVTLHELLYQQLPFGTGSEERARGEATVRSPGAALEASEGRGLRSLMLERHEAGPVIPARPGLHVPRRVQRLIEAGLHPQPSARPANMGEVAATLLVDPARRARLAAAGVVVLGAVGAAFWGGGYLQADPDLRCQAGADVIDDVLGTTQRQQLRQRFAEGGLTATWQVTEPRLTQYVDKWRAMFASTCTAAFSDRRISGELFDLRMDCLDGQRAAFAALVGVGAAEKATSAQLLKLAGAPLPAVAECGFHERPATKPLPTSADERKQIQDINRALAEARTQKIVGDFPQARRRSSEALAAARKLGYEPLLARALGTLADIELRGAKLQEPPAAGAGPTGADRAMGLLEQAVSVAERGRDDVERAGVAIQLALAHRDSGRLAEAERWTELASAIVARIGDPPTQRASVELARGWIQYDRGANKDAAVSFDRSLQLRRQALGPRAPEVLASMTAGCHVKEREPRIRCYREAIDLATALVGPRHPDTANINANLAHVLKDDARTRPAACKLVAEALEIQEAALEANTKSILFARDVLAECLRDEGKAEEARRVYERALERATTPSAARSDLHQSFGIFLLIQNDFEAAVRSFRAAVADRELVFGPAHNMPIGSRYNLADAIRRQGRPKLALQEIDTAIQICERAPTPPPLYPALYELKGYTLTKSGRLKEAYPPLQRSLEIHEKMKTAPAERFDILYSLADLERRTGRLDAAIGHLETAITIRTLEAEPQYFADAALMLALTLAKKGPAQRDRACRVAQQALTGFEAPWAGPPREELAEARKFLAKHRCEAARQL